MIATSPQFVSLAIDISEKPPGAFMYSKNKTSRLASSQPKSSSQSIDNKSIPAMRKKLSREIDDLNEELTDDEFEKKYSAIVNQVLVQPQNHSEKTILHYLAQALVEEEELGRLPVQQLIKLSLKLMASRLNPTALGGPEPVIHKAISPDKNLEKYARLICENGKEDMVKGGISARDKNGETALHIAISARPINLCTIDMLIQYADEDAFSSGRTLDGNTPLHDLADYVHCTLRPHICGDCAGCSKSTNFIERFMNTLTSLVRKYPKAMSTPNMDGKTPYVIHVEEREKATPNWAGHSSEVNDATLSNHPIMSTDDTKLVELSLRRRGTQSFIRDESTARNDARSEARRTDSKAHQVQDTNTGSQSRNKIRKPGEDRSNKMGGKRYDNEWEEVEAIANRNDLTGQYHQDDSYEQEGNETFDFSIPKEDENNLAEKVSQYFLEECFSQESYNEAKTSLFGQEQKHPTERTGFAPQNPLNEKTTDCHQFLRLHSILTYAEVILTDDEPTFAIAHDSPYSLSARTETSPTPESIRNRNAQYLLGVMNWLRDEKGVKRILKLVVRDNQSLQCQDETIEETIRGWDIRYLEWNKLDMSVDTIQKAGAKKIAELSLTSSGGNSALIGWSDSEFGLGSLAGLRAVKIKVKTNLESSIRRQSYIKTFKERMKSRYPSLQIEFDLSNRATGIIAGDHLNKQSADGDAESQAPHRWMKAVDEFIPIMLRAERALPDDIRQRLEENPIKVALIDDGVNPQKLSSTKCLNHGKGWPEDETRATYYSSSEDHGTVMANLILHMCPYIRLYVAKLDKAAEEGKDYDSVADMAAKAVEWARSEKVDIISMSWTIEKKNDKGVDSLKLQIEEAARDNIILFCASEDEGEYTKGTSLPSNCGTSAIKRVGSSDRQGNRSSFVSELHVDYLFPGEGVLEHMRRDLREQHQRGSSASTALASGLAAMILWCAAASGNSKEYFRNESRLLQLFDRLSSLSSSKFVDFSKITDEIPQMKDDKNIGRNQTMILAQVIEQLDRNLNAWGTKK